MLFYIVNYNVIWGCIISALVGAGAVLAFFLLRGNKGKKSADDMKPSDKKTIILGIRDNAADFADLLEPLFLLASGRTARKDTVLDAWYNKVEETGNAEFKTAFTKKFGEVASFKGKAKKYVKCADSILKYVYKAGIERDDDLVETADEKTAEKYDIIGAGSIEAGNVYDVFVPYWVLETETKDADGKEIETETILAKGAIR